MTNSTLMRTLSSAAPDFDNQLEILLSFHESVDENVNQVVKSIIKDVRKRGDEALLEYTNKFDRRSLSAASELVIEKDQIQASLERIPQDQREALEIAAARVHDYHQHQVQDSWQYTEADGTVLGQKITPLARVGLYVPGGKAAYPSSVIMSAIPAKVAGVNEVVLVTPTPDGIVNDMVLAAAAITGIDRVITVGGAQAVAALAYGTDTVQKVDKIVGPGNIYVATAKREVFGQVDIDMIAGPSEILVICDGKTNPDWIAMDLFSQAEHDELAQSILITPDLAFIEAVQESIARLLPTLERKDIVAKSLQDRGAMIHVADLDEALEIANRVAPEHIELSVEQPELLLPKVVNAGAIFMGRYTTESIGDYCAGPNHVLPTSGTARFSSPLGVYDFVKRSSIISCSAQSAVTLGKVASVLARGESLEAHARAAEYRVDANAS